MGKNCCTFFIYCVCAFYINKKKNSRKIPNIEKLYKQNTKKKCFVNVMKYYNNSIPKTTPKLYSVNNL